MIELSDRMATILERLAEMFPDIYSRKSPNLEDNAAVSKHFEYRGIIQ